MIVPAKPGRARELSEPQKRCAARLEEVLGQKVSFDFKDATLSPGGGPFRGQDEGELSSWTPPAGGPE